MKRTISLCSVADIPEMQAKSFNITVDGIPVSIFIVNKDGAYSGYVNRCPHTGVNLDWTPDQFLDNSGDLIQCSTHGALFRIHDGYCIHGPCSGQKLQVVRLELFDNEISAYIPIQDISDNK